MIPESQIQNGNNYFQPGDSNINDILKIIKKLLKKWYWFVLALTIALSSAFLYIRYTPPFYQVQSKVLVGEGNTKSPLSAIFGQGMAQDNRDWASLYNQIAILGSSPIISKTLNGLDFEVSYFSIGRVGETEMYKNAPFEILWNKDHPQVVECDFYLTIHPDNTMSLNIHGENVHVHNYRNSQTIRSVPVLTYEQEIKPNSKIETNNFNFIIVLDENHLEPSGTYRFRFHTHNSLVNKYRSRLHIGMSADYASILNLSINDYNIRKGMEFLNSLGEVYLNDNLERKNQYAELTIQFIDSQLQNISDSLNISEGRLESFRSSNQMIDLSSQSQHLLGQVNQLDNEIIRHKNQNKYYNYLKDYIESNQEVETVIAPSSVGIDDPLLNSFIIQLNSLINEKTSQTSIRPNSEHPTIVQLNTQIEIVKNSLKQSINNIITQSDIELENLNQRMREYNEQIRSLPATERSFVNFERRYKIDSETYTFLLQRLSEARIAKASNVPDGQMLESPYLSEIVHPQTNRLYSLAILLALILPGALIVILDIFNNKILVKDDITSFTRYPVIGQIILQNKKSFTLTPVIDNPGSPEGNAYVSIRTKINLLTKAKDNPVVAITSALPNEGKSYNAINIASSIALTHKSVVLLDLDLRNSKIAETFNLGKCQGVVNYVIGIANINDITYNTKLQRLKVIPAGPIPPNPAEMLSDDKLKELLIKLKEVYDVVILDTPPIGFIADIFQIVDLIDANIVIARYKSTPKPIFKIILEEISRHNMKGVGIILNGIKQKDQAYAGYYGSMYKYGYTQKKNGGNRDTISLEEISKILEEV